MVPDRPLLLSALCYLHGTMTASEKLLEAAIRKGELDDLGLYFTQHLAEERGHLQMLEADLERLGVKRILKFPAAAQLAGAQYYYIEHEHPALLLGYMAALERNGLTEAQVDELEREYGPLSCLRHHAIHDVGHAKELRVQIDTLAELLRTRVRENEAWTVHDYRTRIVPMIQLAAHHFNRRESIEPPGV
jgi:hypothetical protein